MKERDTVAVDDVVHAVTTGGVAVIPTDTVYGLVCDPGNAAAVDRIYAIKRRPADLELTLLAATYAEVEAIVELSEVARLLALHYWPGPLSIIAELRGRNLAIPRSGRTLSCRVPRRISALHLLSLTGALASTSANRHGEPPATTAAEARHRLGGEVDAILDDGPSAGVASTIIDCTATPPRVLREGPISAGELSAFLGGADLPGAGTLPRPESSEG